MNRVIRVLIAGLRSCGIQTRRPTEHVARRNVARGKKAGGEQLPALDVCYVCDNSVCNAVRRRIARLCQSIGNFLQIGM
jgi:hypothetical protein